MSTLYGISKAAQHNQAGDFAAAIAAAEAAIAADPGDPEPLVERAFALAQLLRWEEAVADLERARALDAEAQVLDDDALDDAYFSALLGAAKELAARDVEAGVRRLARYREVLPSGAHAREVGEWQKRLRGELPREFVKRRLED